MLGIVFEFRENYEEAYKIPESNYFLLINSPMNLSSFGYYITETLFLVYLGCGVYRLLREPLAKQYALLFILVHILDLIDFVFTGNTEWFTYHKLPVTFNVIKVLVFGLSLAYEFVRYILAKRIFT